MAKVIALAVIFCAFAAATASAVPEARRIAKRQITHEFKNKNYYLESLIKANFINAFMFCQRMGMQLLTITSNEEYDYLYKVITTEINFGHDAKLWTSGTDMGKEGQFHWLSNGLPVRINKWLPGEPDNDDDEDCLEFWNSRGRIGLNDDKCWAEAYFICESFKS